MDAAEAASGSAAAFAAAPVRTTLVLQVASVIGCLVG
jgi:hypothetical protein